MFSLLLRVKSITITSFSVILSTYHHLPASHVNMNRAHNYILNFIQPHKHLLMSRVLGILGRVLETHRYETSFTGWRLPCAALVWGMLLRMGSMADSD